MQEPITSIAVGKGANVMEALENFRGKLAEIVQSNKITVGHFVMYQEMIPHPIDPRSMVVNHYAVAIVDMVKRTAVVAPETNP